MSARCRGAGAGRFAPPLAFVLTLALLWPAAAAAKPAVPHFRLPASHGYTIELNARGPAAMLRVARASHPRRRRASSVYVARAGHLGRRVEVAFGDLGSVALRFRPSGRLRRGAPGEARCRPSERKLTTYGVFVGRVRFRGEDGYTTAAAHRVKGEMVRPPTVACELFSSLTAGAPPRRAPSRRPHPKRTSFEASRHDGPAFTSFYATADRVHGARFYAVSERTEGRLAIYRFAFVRAPQHAFAADRALSFAAISPPAPFSGRGSLSHPQAGARKVWSGSLVVSFPGEADVPLTGPGFRTLFFRSF